MVKEVIGVGWSNKRLANLPLELKKESAAIIFYSSLNKPSDLAMIFNEYKNFKEIIYIDMEDFEATDIALYDFSAQVPNRKGIEEIVDFVDINEKKFDKFVVSCAAGISRTGAIVKYLNKKGYITNQKFSSNSFSPNQLILSLLSSVDPSFEKDNGNQNQQSEINIF